jgi:methylated-DNA-[protein]-cysteine S-methyltransferase
MDTSNIHTCLIPSPFGPLRATAGGAGIRGLGFVRAGSTGPPPDTPLLRELARQLEEYFDGALRTFSLPLHLEGTPFRRKVWEALCRIPYGEVRTYGEVAASIGRPGAARAVGQANKANPIGIVVPCHRVVAGGGLGGYGGLEPEGLRLKRDLLRLEGVMLFGGN